MPATVANELFSDIKLLLKLSTYRTNQKLSLSYGSGFEHGLAYLTGKIISYIDIRWNFLYNGKEALKGKGGYIGSIILSLWRHEQWQDDRNH
ncbi:hypothetical protein YK48G_17520 [Lentilactobacillus fungorum]|uniref:Uncharacterized protein n=1 Tax=Lentilactobacillus fungorum TaxID=2201250 RepID=A0ABQ3W1K4_9LACO|nr:hypothetical protein YK48G_17520 [Lentilactobacillus fungorum]